MNKVRVLLVDDFQPFRQWVRVRLEKAADFEIVAEAADAIEAVTKAWHLTPDLILLDIGLPGVSGIAAQIQLLRLCPSTRIVFLSGYSDADIIRSVLTKGARGYVLKSDAAHELLSALDAVLSGHKFVSSGCYGAANTIA